MNGSNKKIRLAAAATAIFGLFPLLQTAAVGQIQDITWTLGPNYPSSIKGGAAGVVDGTLVYAGGTPVPALNGSNDSNRTYGIPLEGANWSRLTDMPDSLTYFNGESVGDALYVTGGRSDFQSQGVTYRLTEQNNNWQWNTLASLNVPRGYFGMGQTEGTLMIIGGIQGSGQPPYNINTTMNAPELFDTNNPQAGWQSIPALPGPTRASPIVAGVDGKFYVFGGTIFEYLGADSLRLSDAYMYDPATSLWSTLPNTPFGMSGADAVVYQDRYIVMLGGVAQISEQDRPQFHPQQPGYYNNMVEVFDTVLQTYTIMPSDMPYGTNDIRAAIVGDRIYAVGGENAIPADSNTTPWYQLGQIHAAPPPGNTLFRDGFENGTPGSHPGPPVIGTWSTTELGNSSVQVAESGGPGPGTAADGDQYLSIFRSTEPPHSDAFVAGAFTSHPTDGTVHAEWWAWVPSDIGDFGYIASISDAGGLESPSKIAAVTTAAGTNRVLYRRTTGWDLADITYAYNTWQLWELDWTLETGELTITVNGNSQTRTGIPDAAGDALTKVEFRAGNLNKRFAIDGILVELVTIAGDLNSDGFVGQDDLNLILANWGQNVPPGNALADPSDDGFVGQDDLNFVLGGWGQGTPPALNSTSPVAEPNACLLMALGAAALTFLRRRC